jgi:hypothetical protein
MLLVGGASGQSQKPDASSTQKEGSKSDVYLKQIGELSREVKALTAKVATSQDTIASLLVRLFKVESTQSAYESVNLDLASRSFQRLDSDSGSFLVSVQDASPYLDGYRVTLHIGNPSFASYDGFELTVKWNSKYDWSNFDTSTFDTWQKSERNKELSFTNSLVLGKWNAVELILPSTTAQQLGYFMISMKTPVVSLASAK